MLDDFGNELENTESKIDSTMKKMAKVLHMNNGKFYLSSHSNESIANYFPLLFLPPFADKRQWTAIGVLSLILFIVIILFIIL